MKNKPEETLLLLLLRKLISPETHAGIKDFSIAADCDWERFKTLAEGHGVASLLYPALRAMESSLPEKGIVGAFKDYYYRVMAGLLRLQQEYFRIANLFEENKIPLLALKGISFLADLYARIPARHMGDIDVLVRKEDLPMAEELLRGLRYKKDLEGLKEGYWLKKQYHFVFSKDDSLWPSRLELHWALDYKRNSRAVLPLLWDRIREVNTEAGRMMAFSHEDNLFSLALHLRRMGNIFSLKNVLDAALILKSPDLDWDYVLREAKRGKMRASIYFLLLQAKLLLEGNVPHSVINGLRVSLTRRRRIEKLILSSTFSPHPEISSNDSFVKAHFLLYDRFWEPYAYILNIPQEQFAKFYRLVPYARKTRFFYWNRLFYMPYKTISNQRYR